MIIFIKHSGAKGLSGILVALSSFNGFIDYNLTHYRASINHGQSSEKVFEWGAALSVEVS